MSGLKMLLPRKEEDTGKQILVSHFVAPLAQRVTVSSIKPRHMVIPEPIDKVNGPEVVFFNLRENK
jgi:hypothetical protein